MKKVEIAIKYLNSFESKEAANIFIKMKLKEAGFNVGMPYKMNLDLYNHNLAIYTQE